MSKPKWKNCIEGFIITALGLFVLVSALRIVKNPVDAANPWLNIVAQAKFLPIVMGIMIAILGIYMVTQQMKGKLLSAKLEPGEGKRLAVILPLIAAYLLAIYYFKFTIPTILFSAASLFYLNRKKKKLWVLAIICVVYVIVALILLPKLISLRLP